jgi:hypothetical protein
MILSLVKLSRLFAVHHRYPGYILASPSNYYMVQCFLGFFAYRILTGSSNLDPNFDFAIIFLRYFIRHSHLLALVSRIR